MTRINLAGDGYLLLTPLFGSLPGWLRWGICAAALAVLVGLIVRLYRYELRFVSKGWSRTLLGLRLLIVMTVFVAAVLRPTLRFVTLESIPSHVIIAIDRSDSMEVADPQREPSEKLRLAKRLRLAVDLADDATLDRWGEQAPQGNSPKAPAYLKVIERVDRLSRRDIAEAVLGPAGGGLFHSLGDQHQLQVLGFNRQIGRLPSNFESLQAALRSARSEGDAATDLTLPLNRALELRDELKEGLVGVVVLSDGQHNWGGPPGEAAARLGKPEGDRLPKVPVYTVVCGAATPPADLSLVSVKATPPIVFKHGDANLEVRLRANNLPSGKIRVTVNYPPAADLPDRKPIVEVIEYDGVTQPSPRMIPVRMDRATVERLTVTVEAEDAAGQLVEERFRDNNRREVVINVAPDKAKVLLVDGEARWEMHYLQTALHRDQTMASSSVVFEQPRLNLVGDSDVTALGLPALNLPGPDELPRHDCIVLGDVSAEQLPSPERARLEKYVAERGGTLVVLAGKRSMPMTLTDPTDPIARMLPITAPTLMERRRGFHVALTAEGTQAGFLRLEQDAVASEARWNSLPPHYWGVVGTARPNATVLAHAATGAEKATREHERSSALIVKQNYGFGRVVYIGIDSTWRWRFREGDKYNHRFWSQLIRWAASDRALIAGNDDVRFGVREPVYRGEQEVEFIARLGERASRAAAGGLIGARLLRKTATGEEPAALVPLKPNPEVPGQFEATTANLPPGEYSMEIASAELEDRLIDPQGRKYRAAFQVLPTEAGEMLNLATNWERMKEIADRSGGVMVPAEQAGEIVAKLKSRTATKAVTKDRSLSQSWWLLVPVLALLTAEWLVRKWVGLM